MLSAITYAYAYIRSLGSTSFTALEIVAGVLQPSFQAACRALGLLEDDSHWNSTIFLEEASISKSPKNPYCHIYVGKHSYIHFGLLSPSREADLKSATISMEGTSLRHPSSVIIPHLL
ncbi:hypothetical protein TNIN_33461 [Trichonephila inaurata madagascariensis]|uniref:Uncharacterized protein n=1 Tax=Trichonephila inaurata madagascariensis TaxID=2747483 RepID=A0A8X7CN13_9ARAC|nr:hypothetical protein TNIN_33461 [Trichonephila inaurata madagascariensis]